MVKYREPILVIVFSFITFGIYSIYWLVSTTNELRRISSKAPDPRMLLLLLVPVVNIVVEIWYYWKYSQAVEEFSGVSRVLLFVFWIILSPVSMVLTQIELNKKAVASA